MINFLRSPKDTTPNHNFAVVKKSPLNYLRSKRGKYGLASIIDIVLIVLIIINGAQPAQRLISPFLTSLQSAYPISAHIKTTPTFAFIPSHSPNKFNKVDLNGLDVISFFDVLVTNEGINLDSRGYHNFQSQDALDLFERARYQGVKVFLTLSQTKADEIVKILNSEVVQQALAKKATKIIEENNIDGITLDFETTRLGDTYQHKFSSFVDKFSQRVKSEVPSAQVAVAIPNSAADNNGFYNIESLSKVSDKVFLIAYDFIVPEEKNANPVNPKYGYKEDDYWQNLSKAFDSFSEKGSREKLVLERAWYGNGDNYPLYVPKSQPPKQEEKEPAHVFLDSEAVERLVAGVPAKGREAARRNIPLIGKALEQEGILDSNVLAYALATIEHETDETFEPLEEIQGRLSARRLGYEGGTNYFGRGFIQLTHLRNYRMVGERIGMGDELARNPDLAETPEVAAKILAAFFKDNNVANLASRGQFLAARRPINPDINAWSVAQLAWKYGL